MQFPTHARLKLGGMLMRSKHMNAHETTARQSLSVGHVPQSIEQLVHVSYGASHLLLPQTEQDRQSIGHDEQFSFEAQVPSPHDGHVPQSVWQVKQFSFGAEQTPSPHVLHTPQSGAQERQSSGAMQKPSPQNVQAPQSCGQE